MRARLFAIGFGLLATTQALSQPSPDLSQSDAIQLLLARFERCLAIPIGVHRIGYDDQAQAQYLRMFEQAGIVTVSSVKRDSGNVFQDLRNIQNDPLGSQILISLAANINKNELCTAPDGRPGVPPGATKITEVVRFQKTQQTGRDGLQNPAYVMQGLSESQPTRLMLQLTPNTQTMRKFHALFVYDLFQKRWHMTDVKLAGLHENF